MKIIIWLSMVCVIPVYASNYTVLDINQYQQLVTQSRHKVEALLTRVKPKRRQNLNDQVAWITGQFTDIPYLYHGATGEGDWQPKATSYEPGANHISQYPVYRTDGFDCQTFVQMCMALLSSNNLREFDQHIIKINYGAAGNPNGEIVHLFNRNHFVDGDFNPVNRRNGWLVDVTSHGELAQYAQTTFANLTRQKWFLHQFPQHNKVSVMDKQNVEAMLEHFSRDYTQLSYPRFKYEKVSISYLPKNLLALKQKNGEYQPNRRILDKLPTPAIAEIVYDTKKWMIEGQHVKDKIGTELNVAHFGLLYRQSFKYGELIYHDISCAFVGNTKLCDVRPVKCTKQICDELMFAHATDAYPKGYHWFKTDKGNYVCQKQLPPKVTHYTNCNRVERLPLFNYLTDYQYGSHWYMNYTAVLGVHVEKLKV